MIQQPVAGGLEVLVVILKIYWMLLSETHGQLTGTAVTQLPLTSVEIWMLESRLRLTGYVPRIFPSGFCVVVVSQKDNIKAGGMVLRWQHSNLSEIHSKTQMMCLLCYVLQVGKLEQIRKGKFNLGYVCRREKRLIKNAVKQAEKYSALKPQC